eukprot:TRINITY_DN469_c2_g2_i1.p1 TRINITY_DN469_c2_g2~~TRINITY_DN469_c2_g2_i1.p1  ORF type:complete len:1290 (+),score=305.32 TRINITY_DN469_c2_g2_i1:17-3886(+)
MAGLLRGCCVVLSCILSVLAICPHQRTGLTPFSSLPNANVPNSDVVISAGQSVLLDQSPPQLNSISVLGELIFQDRNLSVVTQFLRIGNGAKLWIGSTDVGCSINNKISITFYGTQASSPNMGMDGQAALGQKGLTVMTDGSISLVGTVNGPTWTRLSQTVAAGSSQITVDDAVNWNVGDQIVIATTDYPYSIPWSDNFPQSINWILGRGSPDQNEQRTVVSVAGNVITLDSPLTYMHWGSGFEKAEVGVLTRNIVIQGSPADDATGFGGHFMIRHVNLAVIQGVEITRMGQRGTLARYPLHFHAAKDVYGLGYSVKQNSVHHSYQRCFVIHYTSGVYLEDNVAFNNSGHCYFLEDGSEVGNTFNHNLGIAITPVAIENKAILPTDANAAMFWITNPNNTFTNNAAVAGHFGYWFSMPDTPTGISALDFPPGNRQMRPRWTPLGAFDANVAHSSHQSGLQIDDMVVFLTLGPELASYTPRLGPYNSTDSDFVWFYPSVEAHFTNFITYKNRGYGVWARGGPSVFENIISADNMRGFNSPPDPSILRNSHIIGETDNIGTPLAAEGNRSRPDPWNNDALIKGWETYDNGGSQFCENVIFENFVSNSVRYAGALSNLECGPFLLQARDRVRNLTFVNANQVYINYCQGYGDCARAWTLYDSDGSVLGHPGWIVSPNNTLLHDNTCRYHPEWAAYDCPPFLEGRYAQVNLDILDAQNLNASVYQYLFVGSSDGKYSVSGQTNHVTYYSVDDPSLYFDSHGSFGINDDAFVMITMSNLKPRQTYAVKFAQGIPTPPVIAVGIGSAFRSDWIYLAIPYSPSHFPLNITMAQWSSNMQSLYPVSSLSNLLSMQQYFYDDQSQHLYLRLDATSNNFENMWGFTSLDGSDGFAITIVSACASNPAACQPTNGQLPGLSVQASDYETLFVASLQYCQSSPTQLNGGGVASLYLNSVNRTLIYHLTYDVPNSVNVRNIYLKKGAVGTVGTIVHTVPYIDNPITYEITVSKVNWASLLAGDMYFAIETDDASEKLRGQIGVLNTYQSPPSQSAADPCTAFSSGTIPIYTDSLLDWGTSQAYEYHDDRTGLLLNSTNARCGNFAIELQLTNGGASFATYPGGLLDTTVYKYLQFYARLGSGNDSSIGLGIILLNDSQHTFTSDWKPITSDFIDNFIIDDQTWTQVRIPLSYLGVPTQTAQPFAGLGLARQDWGYYGGVIYYYLDEIRLIPQVTDIKTPVIANNQVYKNKPICTDLDTTAPFTPSSTPVKSAEQNSDSGDVEASADNVKATLVAFFVALFCY